MSILLNRLFTISDPSTLAGPQSFLSSLVRNEWFRITVLGWLLSKAQNIFSVIDPFSRLLRVFYLESTHHQRAGDSYRWLLAYWRRHPKFLKKARKFDIENKTNERESARVPYTRRIPQNATISHNDITQDVSLEDQEEHLSIAYTPSDGETFWFWHRGILFCLSMTCHDVGSNGRMDMYGRPVSSKENMINVCTFSQTRKPLISLLLDAQQLYDSLNPSRLQNHRYDRSYEDWVDSAMRHKRPLSGIIMEESAKIKLLNDSGDFLQSERWYAQRGIPWKRGYMFNGPPGTGKTSTITALASQYQLPVYLLPIGASDMTDDALARAFQGIPSRSIVVLEDVDVALAKTRDLPAEKQDRETSASTSPASPRSTPTHKSGISLSALLNGVDGVGSGEGRILIMTTNDMSALDPALIRPGRIDLTFKFKRATSAQAKQLFQIFYENWSPASADDLLDEQHPTLFNLEENASTINRLATEWSSLVQDGGYSIAALQGMLLEHKKHPQRAVRSMPAWLSEHATA